MYAELLEILRGWHPGVLSESPPQPGVAHSELLGKLLYVNLFRKVVGHILLHRIDCLHHLVVRLVPRREVVVYQREHVHYDGFQYRHRLLALAFSIEQSLLEKIDERCRKPYLNRSSHVGEKLVDRLAKSRSVESYVILRPSRVPVRPVGVPVSGAQQEKCSGSYDAAS